MQKVRNVSAILLILFSLYTAAFGVFADVIQRGVFLMLAFIIIYSGEAAKKDKPWYQRAISVVLLIVSAASVANLVINFEKIAVSLGAITTFELVLGIMLIVCLLDATRRIIGWPIVIIAGFFLAYAYFGKYFPGGMWHRGFSVPRIISHLYLGSNGVFGTPMGTCATLVIMFVIFGSFLDVSGGGKFFMDIAIAATGKSRGGPAKAAVISSALMGTISGSAATNVVTTGTFTIPLMKRIGYQPHVAGAIEAVASTGGQLMPPVMGAAAFIMAELLGMPYYTIALAAVIPSILYYTAVFAMVHFEAVRTNIQGLTDDEIPNVKKVWRNNWHTLISVVVLIVFLAMGFSAMRAALFGCISALGCSYFRKHTRVSLQGLYKAFLSSAENVLTVATACASAGIIIGVVSQTGLGLKISGLIVSLSGGNLIIALVMTMIALIILGMGMPTAAAYILVATLVAPALINMGVLPLAAHMFVFVGAILSAITPPVALAAYAAAGIAKANPMKIGYTAMQFGIVAFIIPFFFVYQPALLWQGRLPDILLALLSASVGCVALAIGIEGYFIRKIRPFMRIVMIAGALAMIYPGWVTDLIGACSIAAVVLPQLISKIRKTPYVPGEGNNVSEKQLKDIQS